MSELKNKNNDRLSFLMASCDHYNDLWDPFFECMDIFWPDCPYPVYLSTDKKKYIPRKQLHFTVNTLNQKGNKRKSWSKLLMEALQQIPTEYVLLTIDDYFMCNLVEEKYIEEILDIMDADKMIASFQLCGTRLRSSLENKSDKLDYVPLWPKGWATHFMPTIWRKSVLLKWLRPWESAWGFEGYGSNRYRRWHYKEKVYVVRQPEIYDYLEFNNDYSAVVHGRWLNVPELDEFFEKNKIDVDFNKRGRIDFDDFIHETMWNHEKRFTLWQIFVKCINYVRSYFP